MKKIGLVGGISWTSTLDYYRYINKITNEQLGGIHSAETIVYSVNFEDFAGNTRKNDWETVFVHLSRAVKGIEDAGGELIILGANAAHHLYDQLQQQTELPIIHIVDAIADVILAKNIKKVGLLGTRYVMEYDFYKDKLKERGIEPIVPASQQVRDFIQHTLAFELGKGIFTKETKQAYLKIIDELAASGVEGIILGCTEIPLIIKQEDVALPVFDTTRIHAEAAVRAALSY